MALEENVKADLTVVGGGIAGTCAAVAAARLGCETILINDRPVLGGNASSEIRVWINGATGGNNNRYAREGGIMEEILQRNKQYNPSGTPDVWDAILIDLVKEEDNLDLYLNTLVTDVGRTGDEVHSVTGHQHMSERTFTFESPLFVDATGDGVVAAEAGAEWIQGRESEDTYDESAAPKEFDQRTLGSSIMFSSKIVNHKVDYEPPDFAHDFKDDPPEIIAERTDPQQRNECYWWVEYGGEENINPIHDSEEIRDELWKIIYGVWDYIKNSGEFPSEEVDNLQLEWVGKIPGKRESRRILGDYILTEQDVVDQRRFEDRVGHGGWSIDLHPPSGIYDDQGRGSQHYHIDGPYSFPYRSLYARDLDNVFLAGRHISASHVAFGTLRVQMTLATAGQAVGTAAALCTSREKIPSELTQSESDVNDLQQVLLRDDQWIIGVPNNDESDHALKADISASSAQSGNLTNPDTTITFDSGRDIGFHISHHGYLESIDLLLEANSDTTGADQTLDVAVYDEDRPENTIPNELIKDVQVSVSSNETEWIEIPIDHEIGDEQGVFVILRDPEGIRIHAVERELSGVMALPRIETNHQYAIDGFPDQEEFWGQPGQHARTPLEWVPCFRVTPKSELSLYGPENVANGYSRPCGTGNSWISSPFSPGESSNGTASPEPEWLKFEWDTPRTVNSVQLTFNTSLNKWFNIYGEEARAEPETVRDYRVEVKVGKEWKTVVKESGNYRRLRRHSIDSTKTDRLRITIDATNGVPWAELFEVRIYGPEHDYALPEL